MLAAVRAGVPAPGRADRLVMLVVVVTVQVIAAAMRWSAQRPFPVDMRSARATPAPPGVMVGYSTRLALSHDVHRPVLLRCSPGAATGASPILFAVPLLAWSTYRLCARPPRWLDPVQRARVVLAVAA